MENINISPQFILAGDATFTVSNGDGKHYTFHVYKPEPTPQFPNPAWFIEAKTGPEQDQFSYVGRVIVNPGNLLRDPEIKQTPKSRFIPTSLVWKVAAWALKVVWQTGRGIYQLPPGYSIKHDGRCGRCGRQLTHPASLDTGLGPECADMLGVDWQERTLKPLLEEVGDGKGTTAIDS